MESRVSATGLKSVEIPFIDVFYHQSSERHPGHTARARR